MASKEDAGSQPPPYVAAAPAPYNPGVLAPAYNQVAAVGYNPANPAQVNVVVSLWGNNTFDYLGTPPG